MGLAFEVVLPDIGDESRFFSQGPLAGALGALAAAKAASVSAVCGDALVLGADTVVALDGAVMGKPKDESDAASMLVRLSGREHVVHTAVALGCSACGFSACAVESTRVFFRPLARWEIDGYISRNEYIDKAGAYAIQGRAMVFVDRVEGCYYNVVGLPVRKTIDLFAAYANRKGESNV